MRSLFTLVSFLLLFTVPSAIAQVSITNVGVPYTQDFNTLASAGTSSTVPVGWAFLETGTSANTTYAADHGNLNSGNVYSYGISGETERAFGGLQSGSVIPSIGIQFTNNSGATITSITVSYTGEQWRLGAAGRTDRLDFQYSLDATSLNSGTWIQTDALDFTAPVTTGTVGPINGNTAGNRTAITFSINGLNILSGTSFWFRWTDFNPTGSDDGLAIDDFSASFNGVVLPTCAEPVAPATSLTLTPSVNTINGSFTANASATDEYLVIRSTSATLTIQPADGTIYTNGQLIGNGTVVSNGSSTSFNDAGLIANTAYYYFVYAYNNDGCSGGPNYLLTSEDESTTTLSPAPCVTPAAAPTNLTMNSGSGSIAGSFTAASGANRYLTVRSLDPTITFSPANGASYTSGQVMGNATIVSYGSSTSFFASGLSSNTTYYFYIFSSNAECSGEPFYNITPLTGSQTTLAPGSGIPAGYYSSITTQTCSDLKTALYNIIRPTEPNPAPDYGGVCFIYPTTDMRRSDDGLRDIIWDMYSDNPTGPDPYEFEYGIDVDGCGGSPNNPPIAGTTEGLMYNREHSFPRSWFGGAVEPMNSDIMHLFPTDKQVNNIRSSYPYGEVSSPTYTSLNGSLLGPNTTGGYTGTVFEPIDEYKGDFARAQFYMITAYENLVASWEPNMPDIFNGTSYTAFDPWYLQTMYNWHISDPVSAKEMDRNNAVYNIQGNRNPYVDHPEYLTSVLACAGIVVPVNLTSFSAVLRNNNGLLRWTAEREVNFRSYIIERSIDGFAFQKIGELPANQNYSYSFMDVNLPNSNVVFYRLKLTDIDGKFTFSDVVPLQLKKSNTTVYIYPNPAKGNIRIQLNEALAFNSNVTVLDITGRMIKATTAAAGTQVIPMEIQGLKSGTYLIKIFNATQQINQSFIVIQ